MKASYTRIGIGRLCMLFGKTRHAFYDRSWHETTRMEWQYVVLEMVAQIRRELPRIGTPKLYHMIKPSLERQEIKMGRDALHHLLGEHNMIVKQKRRYVVTTNSNHWMKKYPNLIKELVVIQSEEIWVADITYIIVGDDFNFLSLITDAYSKQIMGHCLHPTLEAEGCLQALSMALKKLSRPVSTLVHHSDRGTQYCSGSYVGLLQSMGIAISMTEKGDPYENAIAERINGILKGEFNLNRSFSNRNEAIETIEKSIRAYNQLRPHMSCDYLTPTQAHEMKGILKKKWTPKTYKRISQTIV